jgi:hypothetical protein
MSYCHPDINIEMDRINKKEDSIVDKVSLSSSNTNICCICLDDIGSKESIENDYLTTSCCNHRIHKICFTEWLFSKSNGDCTCPICRNNINDLQDKIHIEVLLIKLNELVKKNRIDKYRVKHILKTYYNEPIVDYFYIECPDIIIENVRVVTYYRILGFVFLLVFILMFSYMILNVILHP